MSSKSKVTKQEFVEFRRFIRDWAFKKMRKLEKKLLYFAKLYFGEPGTITYETPKMKRILFPDGEYFEIPKAAKKEEPCD